MTLIILFFTGLLAGTVDAIAGGGGLISMPMLLSLGMPPHLALGTNKLQTSFGTLMAARRYHRQGLISLSSSSLWLGIICTAIGAVSGAWVSQWLSGNALRQIIPILLTLILLYSLFSPKLGAQETRPRLSLPAFGIVFGLLFGFYDGFLGPGVGSFWVFAITFFLGFHLIQATAYTKVFNVTSNLVALLCFMLAGYVDYRIGLCMAAGQMIGGWIGAHLAIRNGVALVRPFFLTMVCATILSLFYKNYAHLLSPVLLHRLAGFAVVLFVLVLIISSATRLRSRLR